jgi:hypothetical protein
MRCTSSYYEGRREEGGERRDEERIEILTRSRVEKPKQHTSLL